MRHPSKTYLCMIPKYQKDIFIFRYRLICYPNRFRNETTRILKYVYKCGYEIRVYKNEHIAIDG